MGPADLHEIVGKLLGSQADPNVLVGFETSDDAGVYRLSDDLALVQTVDFITPIVDDPFVFGQIAASNSLSDVYAMGGRPLTALNICCFPGKGIEKADLGRILEGAMERVAAAGAAMLGGHTVLDDELKFGLSVTGLVDPGRVLSNAGARDGDALILTKPIGVGVISTAHRQGRGADEVMARAVERMVALNAAACRAALDHGARAATDITGFGLIGHALEIARASGVGLELRYGAIPVYPEALPLIAKKVTTANTCVNEEVTAASTTYDERLTPEDRQLLADPQTSGGLLISLPADRADACVEAIRAGGDPDACVVGSVFASGAPRLRVVR